MQLYTLHSMIMHLRLFPCPVTCNVPWSVTGKFAPMLASMAWSSGRMTVRQCAMGTDHEARARLQEAGSQHAAAAGRMPQRLAPARLHALQHRLLLQGEPEERHAPVHIDALQPRAASLYLWNACTQQH